MGLVNNPETSQGLKLWQGLDPSWEEVLRYVQAQAASLAFFPKPALESVVRARAGRGRHLDLDLDLPGAAAGIPTEERCALPYACAAAEEPVSRAVPARASGQS